ncbi:MAG TPA: hypothetical protein VGO07_03115 [Candidatus Saccharimonadales bacterium]|jgi:hypothetical protein|nr:hypothetical protein [Candidatus Saccharimonadales bacterium]
MAFGDKAAQIEDLTGQLATANQRLAELEPFAGDAEAMHRTYDALSEQAAHDPSQLPQDLYQEAVNRVTVERRRAVVARAAGTIATKHGDRIEAEIIEKEGPAVDAAEEERFVKEEEPALRRSTEQRVRERRTRAKREQLRRDRPAEIEAAYEHEHGEEIDEAERIRFEHEEGERVRADAERRANQNITAATRREITERVASEAALTALRAAETDERFKLRIKTIAETAKRTHQLPMAHLAAGDVVTIDLCEIGQTFADPSSVSTSKYSRQMRLSVISPEHGIVMVMDDSWEIGSPPARRQSFRSGALLTIGTAVAVPKTAKETQEVADEADPMLLITRSVPLSIVYNEADRTDPDFEVDRVSIDTKDGVKLLLGTEKSTSRRGY